MLSFFKRKDKKVEKLGSDSVVDSKELIGENSTETTNVNTVNTSLYFTKDMQISQEDRYYFQFLHNELPPLKTNQIALAGVEVKKEGEELQVIAFIRNTVANGIQFQLMPLTLIGPNGEKYGQKVFDLSTLGELPGNTSTPWMFIFEPTNLLSDQIPEDGWKLAFELRPPHQLDLAETWEQNLPQEDKNQLKKLVEETLPAPRPGEVNFVGVQAKFADNGNLQTMVLVRNGNDFDINLQQLPLFVEDATNKVIAQGVFQLDQFGVKANASKPWTFTFPKEMVTQEAIDLSQWKVYPPKPSNAK